MERHTTKSSRALALIIAVAALASFLLAGAVAAAVTSRSNYVPNEYIIHVTPGTPRTDVDQMVARLGASVINKLPLDDTYLIRISNSMMRPSVRKHGTSAASTSWKIDYIQPNYVLRLCVEPNDEYWNDLWGMKMINMPQAWDLQKGSSTVIVAVNDTGVAKHPDLVDRLLPGYNFVEDNNDPYTVDDSHGTHVAGTIAAAGNNGIGVIGVCWEGVKILPVRVLAAAGGTSADIVDGLDFALKNGAKVVNMSYGGYYNDQVQHNKIKQLAQAGVILVAAAGNDSRSTPGYPASWDEVICVSAVGPTEALATYSNYGSEVDVAAPGGDQMFRNRNEDGILSTVVDPESGEFGYEYYQGTSMASPHVAGAAAILLSHGIAASQVKARLQETARPPSSGSMDALQYGAGIINVYAALSDASLRITKPAKGGVVSTTPEFKISLRGIDTGTIKIYLDYSDGNGDGIPDFPATETPIIDSSNINYYLNTDGTEITVQWPILSYSPLSAEASSNPHQIYVTAEASQTGNILTDWAAFTVANRVIPKGIHLFAFPYSLATASTSPSDILFDKQTGQPASLSLITWVPKTYNRITGRLESRYAYYPNDYLAWTYPYDSMPDPTNTALTLNWNTAGGCPVNDPTNFTFPAGAGFWLVLPQDAVVVDGSTIPTLNAPSGYTINLYEGWNMIGNPYDHAVSWKALFHYRGMTMSMRDAEVAGWIRSSLYGYRSTPAPGYYLLPERSMLQPYTGYWLKALVGGVDTYNSLKMTILP